MSNVIPPLLSNSPPPPPSPEDDDEDEFGDFTGANDLSYGCDNLSLPPSPDHSPKIVSISNGLDINSNAAKNKVAQIDLGTEKDFQDKRKEFANYTDSCDSIGDNLEFIESVTDDFHIERKTTESSSDINQKNHCNSSSFNNEDIKKSLGLRHQITEESECDTKDVCIEDSENNSIKHNEAVNQHISSSIDPEDKTVANIEANFSITTYDNVVINEKISTESYKEPCTTDVDLGNQKSTIEPIENYNSEKYCNTDSVFKTTEISENNANSNNSNSHSVEIKASSGTEDNKINSLEITENSSMHETCYQKQCNILDDNKEEELEQVEIKDIMADQTGACIFNMSHEINSGNENTIHNHTEEQESWSDDDFGDFTFADKAHKSKLTEKIECQKDENYFDESNEKAHCADDDFGNFSIAEEKNSVEENVATFTAEDRKNTEVNDFDEFGDFTSSSFEFQEMRQDEPSSKEDVDDFGDFANFSEVVQEPVILTLSEKQALEKADCILKEIFPAADDVQEEFLSIDMEKDDLIFNELKDITETQALTYQWSKSASQNALLKALNIDARNILYGPSWNPSMPRFAANLSLKPLEPVKTEILTPSMLKSSPSTSTQPTTIEIPSAQFDWNGSGLINPLDYLELLVASLDIPACNASSQSNNSSSPANELDWDDWLQSISKAPAEAPFQTDVTQKPTELLNELPGILQPKPVSSVKQETTLKALSKSDLEQELKSTDQPFHDFDDFASYKSPDEPQLHSDWPNTVPLRETYISSNNMNLNTNGKEISLDIEGWLQPTIVTPELPRKDLVIDEELPNIQTPEFSRKILPPEEIEDDFDDFQMVLPEENGTSTTKDIKTDIPFPINTLSPTLIDGNKEASSAPQSTLPFSGLDLFEEHHKAETLVNKIIPQQTKTSIENIKPKRTGEEAVDDEDEFTEFHCSVPAPRPIISKPLTPILEPLKPVPVYPVAVSTPSAQINWPDPGITDEDIKKFEMVFSRPQESAIKEHNKEELKKIEAKRSDQKVTKKPPAETAIDDDEWSDFVSVQKPSPIHKFHSNDKERTSSPDLTLSVLNLGNIQPTKQPIPVITPHGLVQTKLSSNNMLVNMSPKSQIKSSSSNVPSKPFYHQPQIQPSIISNQYAHQAYNFNIGYSNQNKTEINFPSNQGQNSSAVNQKSLDDEEWSDFVSSPLPQATANGYQQNWQTSQHTSWTNTSPNIIMNPGHFIQGGSDLKSKIVSNISVNTKKSTVPSISLPELEFIAPKGRTSISRKK